MDITALPTLTVPLLIGAAAMLWAARSVTRLFTFAASVGALVFVLHRTGVPLADPVSMATDFAHQLLDPVTAGLSNAARGH